MRRKIRRHGFLGLLIPSGRYMIHEEIVAGIANIAEPRSVGRLVGTFSRLGVISERESRTHTVAQITVIRHIRKMHCIMTLSTFFLRTSPQ